MYNAEIHPKIADSGTDAGRFPTGFERPRRLEEFYLMDCMSSCSSKFRSRLTSPRFNTRQHPQIL
jgi:hypothetical protein